MFSRLRPQQPAIARIRRFATQMAPASGSSKKLLTVGAVGGLAAVGYWYLSNGDAAATAKSFPPALDPNEFRPFPLKEVHKINHNTALYRFSLPNPGQTVEMPTTSFVLTKCQGADGKPIVRPYTPTSGEQSGHLDLIVKTYPTGVMSKHIASLKPGETLDIKGPIQKYALAANQHQKIGIVVGGTGVTPALQIIRKLVLDPKDKTQLTLLFANQREEDILLKDELDKLAREYPHKFSVTYLIDKATDPKSWKGPTGYVNKDLIKATMPPANAENIKIFVCGPPPMLASIAGPKAPDFSQGVLSGMLKDLGYKPEQVFKL